MGRWDLDDCVRDPLPPRWDDPDRDDKRREERGQQQEIGRGGSDDQEKKVEGREIPARSEPDRAPKREPERTTAPPKVEALRLLT